MNQTISFRPSFKVDEFKGLVLKRLKYKSVNSFIEQAVLEKAQREVGENGKGEAALSEIRQVLMKHGSWTFGKPSLKMDGALKKRQKAYKRGELKTVPIDDILNLLRK